MQLFDNTKNWYKGNLHAHTTLSDGQLTPDEVAKLYKDAGYDFLALTDHNILSDTCVKDGLLLLRGVELGENYMSPRRVAYHFVGIGGDDSTADYDYSKSEKNPQKMIDHLKAHGAFVVLCHPDWSLMTTADVMALNGYDAVEVMNTISDPYARGDSSHIIDTVMTSGRIDKMVASDDSHFYTGDHCSASVWVNTDKLSEESILSALKEGKFYASEGPRFQSIEVENGFIRVRTSPVSLVRFMSDSFYVEGRRCIINNCASSVVYEIKPSDTYVRIEAVDKNGRRAWSQYIDVKPFKNK